MNLNARETPPRFRQVQLSREHLGQGVYGPHNTLVPWGSIATLSCDAERLGRKLGIQFDDSFDGLDFVRVALLDLESGRRIALVQHTRAPETCVEIHADAAGETCAGKVLEEVERTLGISPSCFNWRRYG